MFICKSKCRIFYGTFIVHTTSGAETVAQAVATILALEIFPLGKSFEGSSIVQLRRFYYFQRTGCSYHVNLSGIEKQLIKFMGEGIHNGQDKKQIKL